MYKDFKIYIPKLMEIANSIIFSQLNADEEEFVFIDEMKVLGSELVNVLSNLQSKKK